MAEVGFEQLQEWATTHEVGQHASELHGLITGLICAGSKLDADDRRSTLSSWFATTIDPKAARLLDQLYQETAAGLVDQEFGFRLLMPDDETRMDERTLGLSSWCSGFLAGFGMTGRFQDSELSDDLKEVMSDLSRISSFSDEVPEDDDNEADLIEIGEYVRMSALLVFTECAHRAVH